MLLEMDRIVAGDRFSPIGETSARLTADYLIM